MHSVVPTELRSSWAWNLRGTGIWFNVGRTLVFPSPPSAIHAAAIAFLRENCTAAIGAGWPAQESDIFGDCAREKGIDSIQFEPAEGQRPVGTFGITNAVELIMVNLDGRLTCGTAAARDTPLRAGWEAGQPCDCVNREIDPHCGLLTSCSDVLGPTGVCSPSICAAPEPCQPAACEMYSPATCKARSHGRRRATRTPAPHLEAAPARDGVHAAAAAAASAAAAFNAAAANAAAAMAAAEAIA